MNHYHYIIIGTGVAADAAVSAIRRLDREGSLLMIGEEPNPPYDRPPLSKELWKDKPLEIIWRATKASREEMKLNCRVTSIDPQNKSVTDIQGNSYTYGSLLIATGGRPRRFSDAPAGIHYVRTLADYKQLREAYETGSHFAVIGGGFIGSEMAAAFAMNGRKTTLLFPEEGIGSVVFPPSLSSFLNDYFRERGVDVLPGVSVTGIGKPDSQYQIETNHGESLLVDGVIAGIGILPNLELARDAGIKTAKGILVDEMLRTNFPDIYAAGDVAEFYQPVLQKWMKLEHEDNAKTMGKIAGQNMAGKNEPFNHLSYFYSDLFDLGYMAVGELDSRMQTVEEWLDPMRKGIVYYLADGRVRGVLLWNVNNAITETRALISDTGPFTAESVKGKLPLE